MNIQKNCNGYYFKKVNKNLDDVINEKIKNGNYNVWPLREELLENETVNAEEFDEIVEKVKARRQA